MTRIVVSRFGHLKEDEIKTVLGIMNETYRRLEPHDVQLVDVGFYENSSLFHDFISREKMRYGVIDNFDSEFSAIHEAWSGLPRISLCMDRLEQLDQLVMIGTVRHEVGHSVLHGSLEYYVFEIPPVLARIEGQHQLSRQYVRNILYLIAIAVKDFEVTDLLCEHNYYDDQAAYVASFLRPSSNDLISWQLACGNSLAEAICVMGRLKDLLCATPILCGYKLGTEFNRQVESGFSYLPRTLLKKMIDVAMELSRLMKGSTHQKVEIAVDVICKRLLEEILSRS